MNSNLRGHHFGGVEGVRPMLDFRRILSRDLIDNPYLRQDYLAQEERKSKRNKHNDGHILINLPTGFF